MTYRQLIMATVLLTPVVVGLIVADFAVQHGFLTPRTDVAQIVALR